MIRNAPSPHSSYNHTRTRDQSKSSHAKEPNQSHLDHCQKSSKKRQKQPLFERRKKVAKDDQKWLKKWPKKWHKSATFSSWNELIWQNHEHEHVRSRILTSSSGPYSVGHTISRQPRTPWYKSLLLQGITSWTSSRVPVMLSSVLLVINDMPFCFFLVSWIKWIKCDRESESVVICLLSLSVEMVEAEFWLIYKFHLIYNY